MEFRKKDLFTVPNILTYVRILVIPIFVWLMLDLSLGENRIYIALGIFLFAEATDLIDGFVARKFNQISDIGKILDPIADKLLQVAAVVCLTVIGYAHWAFAVVVVVKEGYMLLGGLVVLKISGKKVEIKANAWGKIASVVFTIGYVLAFFHGEIYEDFFCIDWWVLGLASVITVLAGIQYTVQAIRETKKAIAEKADSEKEESADAKDI